MNYEITSNLNSRGDPLLYRNSMSPSVVNERERIMKHTKGKWTAKIHKRARVKYGVRKGEPCGLQQISIRTDVDTIKNHICDVIGYDNSGSSWTSRKEAKANANLIAAAPEMLKRLKTIVNDFDRTGGVHSIHINFARQAIAKAEGK